MFKNIAITAAGLLGPAMELIFHPVWSKIMGIVWWGLLISGFIFLGFWKMLGILVIWVSLQIVWGLLAAYGVFLGGIVVQDANRIINNG